MTDYFKGLSGPAQAIAKLGFAGGVLALFAYVTFSREADNKETNAQHRKVIESVQKTNETNSSTISRQTEILSDLKVQHERTSRTVERMADSQERLTKAIEKIDLGK